MKNVILVKQGASSYFNENRLKIKHGELIYLTDYNVLCVGNKEGVIEPMIKVKEYANFQNFPIAHELNLYNPPYFYKDKSTGLFYKYDKNFGYCHVKLCMKNNKYDIGV